MTAPSARAAALLQVLAGKEERTIADKIADSDRPSWEEFKKENKELLEPAGDDKEMEAYRRELDADRERRMGGGKEHKSNKKKRKKRSKKKKRSSESDSSSSSDDSSDSEEDRRRRKHKKRKKRKTKKRRKREEASVSANGSQNDNDGEKDEVIQTAKPEE